MGLIIEQATLDDVDDLIALFVLVYGTTYPLALGTDPRAMRRALASGNCLWFVTRDREKRALVGSVLFELDRVNRIGKLSGAVVHPEYQRRSIGHNMVARGTRTLLAPTGEINSIYTTTRTVNVAPQLMVLKDGFLPLGIFPNAHKLRDYETLTLLAKFRPGVLDRRVPSRVVPKKLLPILNIVERTVGNVRGHETSLAKSIPQRTPIAFEIIFAREFVKRKFLETFRAPYDRFYPFHEPNLLLASEDGSVELYGYFSKADRYCTLMAMTVPFYKVAGQMEQAFRDLADFGVSYLETLVGPEHTQSLEALLDSGFLPSAYYPAMQEVEGRMYDFVVMTRTMEPLNFKGMAVEKSFKSYVDQYIDLWKQMHLETLQVFEEYT